MKKIELVICGLLLSVILAFLLHCTSELNNQNNILKLEVSELKNKIVQIEEDNKKYESLSVQLTDTKNGVDTINKQIENIAKSIKEINKWREQYVNIPLHGNESSFKSYMDYKYITDSSSPQYKLIYGGDIQVCSDGLLRSGEYIGVALGSKFGVIGNKFTITLDNEKQFKAIKIDEKDDRHTVDGCHHASDGSLIEFVIDTDLAKQTYSNAILMGDFNYIDLFNGKVVKIEREEQQWLN